MTENDKVWSFSGLSLQCFFYVSHWGWPVLFRASFIFHGKHSFLENVGGYSSRPEVKITPPERKCASISVQYLGTSLAKEHFKFKPWGFLNHTDDVDLATISQGLYLPHFGQDQGGSLAKPFWVFRTQDDRVFRGPNFGDMKDGTWGGCNFTSSPSPPLSSPTSLFFYVGFFLQLKSIFSLLTLNSTFAQIYLHTY